MKKLDFNAETHTYTVDGKIVPSVTEIVGMIDFGALQKLNPAVLERAAMRGTLVHEYCEAIDNLYDPNDLEVEGELVPYVKAYLDFLRDYRPEWELIEQPLYHEHLTYAGTVDRFGRIDGRPCVVDIKTTASADKHTKLKWTLQLLGYYFLTVSNGYVDRTQTVDGYILQLKSDGTYMFRDMFAEANDLTKSIFSNLREAAIAAKEIINE